MRKHLMETFDEIYVLDLHGNVKKKEAAPDGGKEVTRGRSRGGPLLSPLDVAAGPSPHPNATALEDIPL